MAESVLPPSFSGPTVDPDHPWLGLHPFAEENHRYFFGRTAEVRDIFLRVRENPLTVLYGQSGLGKTSLLRAGLIPKLRVERFRPVRILLDFGEKSAPLVDQVRAALAAACADPGGDVITLIESWAPLASLWEICAQETIRPPDLADKPPVLIIDQVEEVFTLAEQQAPAAGSRGAEVAELFAQIGDLVENRAPVALQKTFKQDPRLALAYDSSPTAVRLVLSLREDYLAQLEQWKSTIPSLMRNRMPLRLLTGSQAFEAVVRPGRIDGRNLVSDRVGEQIVRFVAKRPDDIPLEEIEAVPPLLSLVCERLNTARLEAKSPQEEISDELVKSQGTDILQRFYDESFAAFPDAQREVVREYVEDRMVTVGGHRNPVAREDAVAELARQGVSEPDNVLDALIARRLLTAERRGGIQRLEITHDVLTPLAVRGRKDRQERRDIEQAKRKQAETEVQLAREIRLRNLFRVLAVVTLGALVVVVICFYVFAQANYYWNLHKYTEALPYLNVAAYAGNSDCMYRLGDLYKNGWVVNRDYEKARYWYQKSADAGNPWGMSNLGDLYMGVDRDYKKARYWYQKSADAGNRWGIYDLGKIYELGGFGVDKNVEEAKTQYKKASEAGDNDVKKAAEEALRRLQ